MRIFVYEFVTGGGWYSCGALPLPGSLLSEGLAMLRALVEDLTAIGAEVSALWDRRHLLPNLPTAAIHSVGTAEEERAAFHRVAAEAEATILIAPEFCGFLLERCRWAEGAGARLVSPSSGFVELTSDKHRTAEVLSAAGVAVPHGLALDADQLLPREFRYPAVLKPRDGAGSQSIRLIDRPAVDERALAQPSRMEEFCPGVAASVAVLCGPAQQLVLPPCGQILSDDGRFTYLGGRLPLEPALASRARGLARQAMAAVPKARGYVGIDLVLGGHPDGREDVVIEINPRLTTSYVGLRQLARGNISQAMLAIAGGQTASLSFDARPLQFEPDGRVRRMECAWGGA